MFPLISEDLVKRLMLFGLSKNEAKVYIALLQLKRAGATEIAKLSSVPRQEVYRVLPRLEKLGIAEVIIGKPTKFLAINPEEALSELIEYQQEILKSRISELRREKDVLVNELEKIQGKSARLTPLEPAHYILISGQRLVNEKIQEMLQKAKNEVLWMAPKLEIKVAIIYGRDEILHRCAHRKVKIRIITEVNEKNVDDVVKLSKFCEIRHAQNVTSTITIVDDKELIIGSALHVSESLNSDELRHKLWTNDLSHITVMRDFFEKVWSSAIPAKL
ncbi:MAG: helix-turn-helix domain-containing protein [Candidatus Bathyarchaeia archaeon]